MIASTAESPLVSVIMIFRDAGRFIEEAIESVIRQTWPHWELLLVDDGSVDASREIAEAYRRRLPEQVRILEHPGRANRGMSAARNIGLAAARGDLVAFLDADDVYLPERLERHVRLFERYPEAGAVQSCVEYWHSWARGTGVARQDFVPRPPPVPLEAPVSPPSLLVILLESRGATVPGICAITVRRPLLQALGGSEEAFRAHYEDQVLFSKVYLSMDVVVTADTLARYRQHPASATGRHRLPQAGASHPWYADRAAFFDWLEGWLAARPSGDDIVLASLRRARLRHMKRAGRGIGRAVRRGLHGLLKLVLPESLESRLFDWWGRKKLAFAAHRAVQASSRMTRRLPAGAPAVDSHDRRRGRG